MGRPAPARTDTFERIIEAVLVAEASNRSRAARRLGVSLRTLQRRAARSAKRAPRKGKAAADRAD